MPMKTTHRRNLFFARKMWRPAMSEYAYEYAVKMRPWHCKHVLLLRVVAITLLILAILCIVSSQRAQTLINPPTPPPMKQTSDTDRLKNSKLPVAYADDIVTITFHNCRENTKHHWSCQRVDGDDTVHYVYIPGLKPTHIKPGIGITNTTKGEK